MDGSDGLGAIAADGNNGLDVIIADDNIATGLACLGATNETLGGSVWSAGVGEWVRSVAGLGGVGGGLKVFVDGFTAIGGLREVEFGGWPAAVKVE